MWWLGRPVPARTAYWGVSMGHSLFAPRQRAPLGRTDQARRERRGKKLGRRDAPSVCPWALVSLFGFLFSTCTSDWEGLSIRARWASSSFVLPTHGLPVARGTSVGLSTGGSHTCAVNVSGQLLCWGSNESGQLGSGHSGLYKWNSTPTRVSTNLTFTMVTAGESHTCATTSSGATYCWGAGYFGELGHGSLGEQAERTTPASVSGGLRFHQVSAGFRHTCAVTPDDIAYCWGAGELGQLGNGVMEGSPVPTAVAGNLDFTELDAGFDTTCGISGRGEIYCWGTGGSGQLGHGSVRFRASEPVQVAADSRFVSVSVGGGVEAGHACAVSLEGRIYCWGDNTYGQLGAPSAGNLATKPVLTELPNTSIVSVTAGGRHTCALDAEGVIYCWGYNSAGQVGNTRVANQCEGIPCVTRPMQVPATPRFLAISAGTEHSCGLASAGTTYCWGFNGFGRLGAPPDSLPDTSRPTPVLGF